MRAHYCPQFLVALGLAAGAIAAPERSDAATCKMERLVELPISMNGRRPLIEATINGAETRFILDSGAFYSIIPLATAEELKLRRRPLPEGFSVWGVNGRANTSVTTVSEFGFAGIKLNDIEFLVGGTDTGAGAVGLIGQNFLTKWDVEYDLAKGVVRLFRVNDDCAKANLAYWVKAGESYSVVDLIHSNNGDPHTESELRINGQRMVATWDTGAGSSVLALESAKRAGFTTDGQGVVATGLGGGIGEGSSRTWTAPIKDLEIGGEKIGSTRIGVMDADLLDADLLLGADFFLSHHILVSNSQDKIYFTYNGGPVFDFRRPPKTANSQTAGAVPATPDAGADDLASETDADALTRRGAAAAARGDLAGARAALDRALQLAPNQADIHRERGRILLAMGQRDEALGEFGQALQLKPDDVRTLLARVPVFAKKADWSAAMADMQVLDRVVPSEDGARMTLGEDYLLIRQPQLAINEFSLWLRSHIRDSHVGEAKNNRCWARALANVELSEALDDCNAAISLRDDDASAFDTRGLVYLRLGRDDAAMADYDHALKLNAKLAWSHLGRALVHFRRGENEPGRLELAEAKRLRATIVDDARVYGLGVPDTVEAGAK